ncbi:MAG: hypothetical protein ABF913_02095 [Oenococcus sp.]|uniref:hypothetical protein n=1 Tax=Oenococcus sp. TaxID=1979414 RepID=UPI0039EB01A3
MAHISRKPDKRISKHFSFFIGLSGMALVLLASVLTFSTKQLPVIPNVKVNAFLLTVNHWLFITGLILGIFALICWLIPKIISKYHPDYLLYHHRLDNFLYSVGVTSPIGDEDSVQYPNVKRTSDGFKIEAIANTQDKLLTLNDALSNLLARNGSKLRVSESYVRDGWVCYVLETDFRHDQLKDK